MSPRRGEVWLVDFGEPVGRKQSGRRPAVVVSADALNEGPAGVIMVVPYTATHWSLPSHIEIESGDSALDVVSYVECEDLKSISEQRLITRLGQVSPHVTFEISRAFRFLLEL